MDITKPFLATDADPAFIPFPIIAQPKIDGVRGLWLWGRPSFSGRSLKPFPNRFVGDLFNNPEIMGIDGELTYGSITAPRLCSDTTSVTNSKFDDRAFELILNAFDCITPETVKFPYEKRLEVLTNKFRNFPNIRIVPSKIVNNLQELSQFEDECLSQGYEGVILRRIGGYYKNGRSSAREALYLRIKRFVQEDAIVLRLVEAMANNNEATTNALGYTERSSHQANKSAKGMVGSLICKDIKTGLEITVGSGELNHEQRIFYWNNPSEIIGKVISYKSFPKGVKDKPRFPTFVNIRDESDLVKEY